MLFFKKWRERRKAKRLKKQSENTQAEIKEESYSKSDEKKDLKKKIKDMNEKEDTYDTSEEKRDLKEKIDEVKAKEIGSHKREDEKVEKLKTRNFTKPKVTNHEPDWPKNTEKVKESTDTKNKKNSPTKSSSKKYTGKYEIYPEAGAYKFRLKASNGEVLAASYRYSTEKGAISGIDTFKKNVEEGQFNIVTDKNGYSQFRLFNTSGARVIIAGEVYQTVTNVNSAIESVKNFYKTDKVEVLDELPKSEIREENIEFDSVEELDNGKYEIYKEDGLYFVRLKASNSQVLFVSQGYASKASAKNGLKTIQNAIKEKNFTIEKDKQNRFQFNLHSANGQMILTGESYPVRNNCISAAHSVLKFGLKAPIVEL